MSRLLEAWLLVDGACLAYQADTQTLLLTGSLGGATTVVHSVARHELEPLLTAPDVRTLTQRATGLVAAGRFDSDNIHQQLGWLRVSARRQRLQRSPRDAQPLDMRRIRRDPEQEQALCARDADCGGEHLWVMLEVEGESLIWHLDRQRATVVPPRPLRVLTP